MTSCSYLGGAAGKLTAADVAAAWGCLCGQVPPAAESSHPEEIRHACTNTSFLSYMRTATTRSLSDYLVPSAYAVLGEILRAIMSNPCLTGLDSRSAPSACTIWLNLVKSVYALKFMLPYTHAEL